MTVSDFREKSEVEIRGTKFLLSKMPAIQGQQIYGAIMREISESGDSAMTYLSTETGLQLLQYSAVQDGENWIVLDNEQILNFACETIIKVIELEAAMIRYNFDFLFDGSLQKVLDSLSPKEAAENPAT